MKIRKIISYTIDVILLLLIGVFVYAQVSMMTTRDKNYGVPKVFGTSMLCIVTNSMDDGTPNCLAPETGIIISHVDDIKSLTTCKPLSYSESDPTRVNDYDKSGDIVTFYLEEKGVPDTHRVIDYIENEDGSFTIRTMGDNPIIRERFTDSDGTSGFETWNSKFLIGKVTYVSRGLGQLLIISSPSVAASFNRSAWLFPVGLIAPIVIIASTFMIEEIIKYRKESKRREALINEEMAKAGIDMNDEEAVELFRMKMEMKLDIEEEREEIKAKMRSDIEKEKEKQKKAIRKEYEKNRKR